MSLTYDEAKKKIAEHVAAAEASIAEAEKLADEHLISFGWDLAYGMGGWYHPSTRSFTRAEALALIESGQDLDYETKEMLQEVLDNTTEATDSWTPSSGYEDGWQSSSSSC